jgi:SMI1 / KNR4 family (SUKH-1)
MEIHDWQEFYDSLFIDTGGYGVPVPKPTPTQLDRFEEQTGLRLPRSYRAFLLVFGPGEFSASLRIAAPGYEYAGRIDLLATSRSYGWSAQEIDASSVAAEQKAHLHRLFYFGLESGREWLGWDPADIRDAEASEYGIYRVEALGFGTELVATSFRQLVEVTCELLFSPNPAWDEEELGPQRTFFPGRWAHAPNGKERQA